MSWRKWNIRAELEGAELKPHEKPKINLDVSKKRKNVSKQKEEKCRLFTEEAISSVFSKNIHL